jgi:hypothetical protein
MGTDEKVAHTVNALFTAITSHNAERLIHCELTMHALEAEGKLPQPAAKRLDAIVRTAHEQQWLPAAQSLSKFIQAQTGERDSNRGSNKRS